MKRAGCTVCRSNESKIRKYDKGKKRNKMNINIITVGKLKEKYWKDAVSEYCKRLKSYCRITITELKDVPSPANASHADEENVKNAEGEEILKVIKKDDFVITLEINGKELDSIDISKKIEQLGLHGRANVDFIIGGSLGLSKEVCRRSDFALSFSKMTFPHQMMRVILLEQIYRSFKIMKNETYHK